MADADALDMELQDDPSQEGEDDLSGDTASFSKAVVTSTDWTTATIVAQLVDGAIDLSPSFQRRNAWRPDRKSRFIESLFLGLPIPELVLAERRSQRGSFIVIDGKQRLLTLREFVRPDGEVYPTLRLRGLDVLTDLNGETFDKISINPAHSTDIRSFNNQPIRTVVVRNWSNDDFLYHVFLRLNTGSLPLSPQELRQALIPGPFLRFLDEYSGQCRPLQIALGLRGPDFRMRDVELLLRFFAYDFFLDEYRGNLKVFLDDASVKLNQKWKSQELDIRARADACGEAIDTTLHIFGEHAFRRWSGNRYQGIFNRAVFDIMVFCFKDADVAAAAKRRRSVVVSDFKQLSREDEDFARSVESTTKSVDAVWARLGKWADRLGNITDREIAVPPKPVTA